MVIMKSASKPYMTTHDARQTVKRAQLGAEAGERGTYVDNEGVEKADDRGNR
jgi:hypothetical protein